MQCDYDWPFIENHIKACCEILLIGAIIFFVLLENEMNVRAT